MIRASVIGSSGYTGMEAIRLLLGHPEVEVVEICSRTYAGKTLTEAFPFFPNNSELVFAAERTAACDVVFFAAPNGVAMSQAESVLKQGIKVIDISADFRLPDTSLWEAYYAMPHQRPDLLKEAVYGLPELYRSKITQTNLVANPGCYPTSVILGFYPLLKAGCLADDMLIADCKSGVSGAGRRADMKLNFSELDGSFKAYKASKHRHFPEIKTQLDAVSSRAVNLSFTPHLVPMSRGIFSTLYFHSSATQTDLQKAFEETYAEERFVAVLPPGSHPDTRNVRGTNNCHIAVHKPADSDVGKVLVVIDNLVKGASGQAVQNMNLMFDLAEDSGLESLAILP